MSFTASNPLLERYPILFEKFTTSSILENSKFVENLQQQFLIGILAVSAITSVGGIAGMCLSMKGYLKASAFSLSASVLGATIFYFRYQYLTSIIVSEAIKNRFFHDFLN